MLFPTPKVRELEMIEPISFKPNLVEPPLQQDSTSSQQVEQLPIYNAYSIDGDVTGELVYVNYGVPKDYEELELRGIDVTGKIVIVRYAGSWRGIKPKVAAEHRAIGTIIYSDPKDDGFVRGDVYPKGSFRSDRGAQRGSVMDMPLYPGDPLTPGIGATRRAKRIDLDKAETLTKIPVMPISHSDALPLLSSLDGPIVPEEWKGGLPITYHLGPGPAKVRMKLEFSWDMVTLFNVIAKMQGRELPDQWIVRGNHHDAWVNGARDPVSGLVALLAEARAVGILSKNGKRPRRTIVYAAWDAEEQGLIGSTEWTEHHAKELVKKVVAYINSDSNGRGFLRAGGSHALEVLVNEVASEIKDAQADASILERYKAAVRLRGKPDQRKEIDTRENIRLYPLGSGSDYTPEPLDPVPFLDFSPIQNAMANLKTSADDFDNAVRLLTLEDPPKRKRRRINELILQIEQRLTKSEGLPRRSWYKHFIYAPGFYTGYGVKTLPGVREAIEQREWAEASAQINVLADVLMGLTSHLDGLGSE